MQGGTDMATMILTTQGSLVCRTCFSRMRADCVGDVIEVRDGANLACDDCGTEWYCTSLRKGREIE